MTAPLYNENDPFVAAWLRELMLDGHIPAGGLDERSIRDVVGADCAPTSHFFAGIGGWPYALRLAGWPDGRPVWTGSCPCQPFSAAGKRLGAADERHLWPDFLRLIAERRPPTIFGEQVASRDGREWLAGVRADLEALGYAVGAADLCAASASAPHIRQRLFWVADTDGRQPRHGHLQSGGQHGQQPQDSRVGGGLGDADEPRPQGCGEYTQQYTDQRPSRTTSFWSGAQWLSCLDGKARRVEPSIFPLAHGVSNRVGLLRGAGNAIIPQLAVAFVRAFMGVSVE